KSFSHAVPQQNISRENKDASFKGNLVFPGC
ncbi:hypothetical protein ISN45_At05g024890, partial [Arabidopsis thaliana x Arabidopsis arenosa]